MRLRHDAQVRLGRVPAARVFLARVLVGHGAGDDDVLALPPVGRRRDLVLGRELQRIDDPQHLVEVAAGRHGIDHDQLDELVRPDDEDVAHRLEVRQWPAGRSAGHLRRQHAVELGDLELGVADQRIVGREALGLLDVTQPAGVALHRIDRQAGDLHAAPVELRLDLGQVAQLGRADRREILGMREQDGPTVADPFMEPDAALGGFGLEVGRLAANAEQGSLHRWGSEPHDEPLAAMSIGGCMDSIWRKLGF